MPGPRSQPGTPSRWSSDAGDAGHGISGVQASVPYFRHVNDDDMPPSGKTGYLYGSISGPETPGITVQPPRRAPVKGNLRVQKSFDPSIGRQRSKGDSKRRSWDGNYEPEIREHLEPKWVPGGAQAGAPGHAGRSSPQRPPGSTANPLQESQGWSVSGAGAPVPNLGAYQYRDDDEEVEQDDNVMASYASMTPSEVQPSAPAAPAAPPAMAQALANDAAALLEAARGSRPRDAEGQNLENLDEQFYERLSKLRDDHQRNLNEISRLYESSVEAGGDGSEQPMMQQQMRSEPQPEMARPEMTMPEMMSDAEAGMADPDDNRPWWQRDDKDYGEVLRRLKALDIPLPPGAGGPSPSADTQDAERDKRALYSWSAEGGPGAGEGPWGEREAKTKRPASAPRARRKEEAGGDKDGWIARSTVPQPFKFDSRPKRPSIMAERTSYDLEVKRRLDQAECSTRFRAEPIPPTTMLPLFEKQEREKEAVRAKRVADRFQYLQETSGIQTQSPPRLEFQRGF